jgi:hypothetical protein
MGDPAERYRKRVAEIASLQGARLRHAAADLRAAAEKHASYADSMMAMATRLERLALECDQSAAAPAPAGTWGADT